MIRFQIKQRPLLTHPEQFQGVPTFIAEILARRGVNSSDELDLKLKHLLAPQLKDLDKAIQLIDQAIDQQQKIVIVGDICRAPAGALQISHCLPCYGRKS